MIKRCIIILLLTLTIVACETGPSAPRGFSLPIGDIENGKQVFNDFQCLSCHTLNGADNSEIEKTMGFSVDLGGKVSRIKTYAELVTSIINPSHKISKSYNQEMVQQDGISKMRNYNDVMTVTQLIDLVTFLQPHYQLYVYAPTHYSNFR